MKSRAGTGGGGEALHPGRIDLGIGCAPGTDRLTALAGPAGLSFLRLRAGHPQPLDSPAEAAAYPYSDLERAMIAERFAAQAIGSPDTVRRQLAALIERTGADELMLTTQVYDITDRIGSFELIAEKVAGGLAG